MRILLIHNYYKYQGGEEVYVESLKKLLEKNGHKVILYTKNSKNIKTLWDKIKVGFNLFWNTTVARELNELIQKEVPDVVHFNNIYPLIGATAYLICKKNRVKVIQTIHNYRFMCPKGILYREGGVCELCISKRFFSPAIQFGCYHGSRAASFLYSFAFFIHKNMGTFTSINTYIFPSLFTQQYYQRYFGISGSRSIYLPHFVDLQVSKKKIEKENWYLYVGRLSEEKGILQLLEVFKNLPKFTLKVIGEGPQHREVNIYRKYKNIHILGHVQRVKLVPYYQKARALIVPSLFYEIGPLVSYEATALNTPIIIAATSSNDEDIKISLKKKLLEYNDKNNSYPKNRVKISTPEEYIKVITRIYSQYTREK